MRLESSPLMLKHSFRTEQELRWKEKAPRDDPRGFFRAFSLALVEPGFNRSPRTSDHPVGRVGEVFRADRIERSECRSR